MNLLDVQNDFERVVKGGDMDEIINFSNDLQMLIKKTDDAIELLIKRKSELMEMYEKISKQANNQSQQHKNINFVSGDKIIFDKKYNVTMTRTPSMYNYELNIDGVPSNNISDEIYLNMYGLIANKRYNFIIKVTSDKSEIVCRKN